MSLRVSRWICPIFGLMISAGALAEPELQPVCEPKWHNAMSLQDGALNLDLAGEASFQIESSGQLYFGRHKVMLDEKQMAVLADYHRLMLDDLPYTLSHSQLIDDELCNRVAIRQAKENEIQSQIPALKRWQSVTLD